MIPLPDFNSCFNVWTVLALFLVMLYCLYKYGSKPMGTWSRLGVPGPQPLPFVGNMHQLLKPSPGLRATFTRWQHQYGRVFGIMYFRKPCLVVTDMETVKEILVKDFNTFCDRFTLGKDEFIPDSILKGLIYIENPDWRRIHRITSPIFTVGKLKLLTCHMNIAGRNLAVKCQEYSKMGTHARAKDIFGAYSFDVIARSIFSLDQNSQNLDDNRFHQIVENIFKVKTSFKFAMVLTGSFPFIGHLFKRLNMSIYDTTGINYCKKLLLKLYRENSHNSVKRKNKDLFQFLVDAEVQEPNEVYHDADRKLTREEVINQGITLLMAGYETSSSTLVYLSHILGNHRAIQNEIREEILSVVGCSEEVTYEHCHKLIYTEAALMEVLRMYPTLSQLRREAKQDTVLKGGIKVPKDSGIIIPVYNIGRDPEIFDDPATFRPERYLDDNTLQKPFHFLPFGAGPRHCLGMRLAMIKMKVALVYLLRNVDIVQTTPSDLRLEEFTGFLRPTVPVTLSLQSL